MKAMEAHHQATSQREKEAFKRYNDFRTVKVNSDRIDFDLKTEDLEKLIE